LTDTNGFALDHADQHINRLWNQARLSEKYIKNGTMASAITKDCRDVRQLKDAVSAAGHIKA